MHRNSKAKLKDENGRVCNECHTVIKQLSNTTRHTKVCKGVIKVKTSEHRCSLCNATFCFGFLLKKHAQMHENSGNVCEKCERSYK